MPASVIRDLCEEEMPTFTSSPLSSQHKADSCAENPEEESADKDIKPVLLLSDTTNQEDESHTPPSSIQHAPSATSIANSKGPKKLLPSLSVQTINTLSASPPQGVGLSFSSASSCLGESVRQKQKALFLLPSLSESGPVGLSILPLEQSQLYEQKIKTFTRPPPAPSTSSSPFARISLCLSTFSLSPAACCARSALLLDSETFVNAFSRAARIAGAILCLVGSVAYYPFFQTAGLNGTIFGRCCFTLSSTISLFNTPLNFFLHMKRLLAEADKMDKAGDGGNQKTKGGKKKKTSDPEVSLTGSTHGHVRRTIEETIEGEEDLSDVVIDLNLITPSASLADVITPLSSSLSLAPVASTSSSITQRRASISTEAAGEESRETGRRTSSRQRGSVNAIVPLSSSQNRNKGLSDSSALSSWRTLFRNNATIKTEQNNKMQGKGPRTLRRSLWIVMRDVTTWIYIISLFATFCFLMGVITYFLNVKMPGTIGFIVGSIFVVWCGLLQVLPLLPYFLQSSSSFALRKEEIKARRRLSAFVNITGGEEDFRQPEAVEKLEEGADIASSTPRREEEIATASEKMSEKEFERYDAVVRLSYAFLDILGGLLNLVGSVYLLPQYVHRRESDYLIPSTFFLAAILNAGCVYHSIYVFLRKPHTAKQQQQIPQENKTESCSSSREGRRHSSIAQTPLTPPLPSASVTKSSFSLSKPAISLFGRRRNSSISSVRTNSTTPVITPALLKSATATVL